MDLLGRDNIVATETDSLYFPRELLDRIPINEDSPGYCENRPWCKIGKQFGNMEVEYDRIDRGALFLEKKCYTFQSGDKRKMVFKGSQKPTSKLDDMRSYSKTVRL